MSASLVRAAARSTRSIRSSRAFSVAAVARKDFVQDLYVKELKAYKAPVAAKDAHVGSVKEINLPKAPTAPSEVSDLSAELTAYDQAVPDLADAPAVASTGSSDAAGSADGFLAFLEADIPKAEAHH